MKLSRYAKQVGVSLKTCYGPYRPVCAGLFHRAERRLRATDCTAQGLCRRQSLSDLNDTRPKLEKLLADTSIGTIVVEKRDRLTRFGSHYIETLLEAQGRHVEMIFQSDTGDELVDDFVAVITSMSARIYGRRQSKRRAEKIKQCVESVMQSEEE